ncbi:MAG: LysR substrate-binding domain-containing protein [Pseudomonadota bacterium]|nr:LysR substrate-binding domain-containing protein [Pseudomonadota bacterium]
MAISTGFPERAETLSVTRLVAECCGSVCRPDVLPEGKRLAARSFVDAPLLHTETRADAWPNWLKMVGNEEVDPSRCHQYEHFYFKLQAAVSGLGLAIGSHPLVVDDLISGQLLAPFGFVESGNHNYFSCRGERANDPRIDTFRIWLVVEADSFIASGQLATN